MAKLPEDIRSIFTDVYRFYEAHWDMPDRVENWQGCVKDIGAVLKAHDGNRLAEKLLMACYETMDENTKDVRSLIGT